jgi:hypothetical protein
MRNTAYVTGGKPIAVLLQSISGASDINRLVTFYDIHGGKREVLFFYFVPDTTRDFVLLYVAGTQNQGVAFVDFVVEKCHTILDNHPSNALSLSVHPEK